MRKFIEEHELLTWKFALFLLLYFGFLAALAFFYLQ